MDLARFSVLDLARFSLLWPTFRLQRLIPGMAHKVDQKQKTKVDPKIQKQKTKVDPKIARLKNKKQRLTPRLTQRLTPRLTKNKG
jgi:hypothetical protein